MVSILIQCDDHRTDQSTPTLLYRMCIKLPKKKPLLCDLLLLLRSFFSIILFRIRNEMKNWYTMASSIDKHTEWLYGICDGEQTTRQKRYLCLHGLYGCWLLVFVFDDDSSTSTPSTSSGGGNGNGSNNTIYDITIFNSEMAIASTHYTRSRIVCMLQIFP